MNKTNKTNGSNVLNGECIIFIHGLGRSSRSFRKMQKYFKNLGYAIVNVDYSSMGHNIEEISELIVKPQLINASIAAFKRVHFVTHSMGGIILRVILGKYIQEFKNLGNVVQLAPPNQGSKRADRAGWIAKMVYSEVLKDLETGPRGICHKLPPVNFYLGVIASNIDGKVKPEEAWIDGMTDSFMVRRFHTFIMKAPEVMEAIHNFITTGKFRTVNEVIKSA